MLYSLLTGITGILVILAFWFVVQAIVRARSGCSADTDVLEYMAHGCGACDRYKGCRNRGASGEKASAL